MRVLYWAERLCSCIRETALLSALLMMMSTNRASSSMELRSWAAAGISAAWCIVIRLKKSSLRCLLLNRSRSVRSLRFARTYPAVSMFCRGFISSWMARLRCSSCVRCRSRICCREIRSSWICRRLPVI